jgi:3',5'-nucleoside bisphosphate phosphatase
MRYFRADLHIHTVLSPCGDLDMSPRNIVAIAKERGLDIIAITDHNSTLHGPIVRKLAEPHGITVLYGAEVTTREETHCLCIFEDDDQREAFQNFININLPKIANNPNNFGYQVVVNEVDEIIEEIEPLLISALNASIDEVENVVHSLNGLFIPAHVDRPIYSLISQLGFIPHDLNFDALEIFRTTNPNDFLLENKHLNNPPLIKNSDSHYTNEIGSVFTQYLIEEPTIAELKKAFLKLNGRDFKL